MCKLFVPFTHTPQVNPLAGCLPALFQIPVFLALYRSFFNLAAEHRIISESFLWLPNLEGPVYGARSADWLLHGWHDYTPQLGWHDTLAFATIPLLLYLAQALSLRVLTPPSDDPAVQKSQVMLLFRFCVANAFFVLSLSLYRYHIRAATLKITHIIVYLRY